ncbi:MAG TPA: acetolactate decarboxylase [Actinomycetota bacterium]|jgi:hypothetical protein|nr:acetolactate decarboxylase [Actinomycetota bacterium]
MYATRNRPTLVAFNTVQRLLRGDFFHAATRSDIRVALAEFPSDWKIAGLGTTNWFDRNGEIIIDGSTSEPRFLWADPLSEEPCAISDLTDTVLDRVFRSPSYADMDGVPSFPFAAVAAFGPTTPSTTWHPSAGDDLHSAIAWQCAAKNIGLAAVRVTGQLGSVEYQSMRRIPLGGASSERPVTPIVSRRNGISWQAFGFYTQNPTLQALLGFDGADVHLHGYGESARTGGHVNRAVIAEGAEVTVVPLKDFVLRIHGLDAATLPVRDVA